MIACILKRTTTYGFYGLCVCIKIFAEFRELLWKGIYFIFRQILTDVQKDNCGSYLWLQLADHVLTKGIPLTAVSVEIKERLKIIYLTRVIWLENKLPY
jgi:hypothetical protein